MNRLEWILTALIAFLLVMVAILAALFWTQPGFTTPLPTIDAVSVAEEPASSGNTALLAFVMARDAAHSRQEDAQLVRASATWPLGASRDEMARGEADWNFSFFSPASNSVIVITVIGDQAQVIQERDAPTSLQLHTSAGWQVDSHQAVRNALSAGGDGFLLEGGSTTLTASLTTTTDTEHIEWFISFISRYTGKSFTVRLDANSGNILSIEEAP